MDRVSALGYLKSTMDAAMLSAGRGNLDSADGYGPALDAAFGAYILKNSLSTTNITTTVQSVDVECFKYLLTATTYDLIIQAIALSKVDFSVDGPLTNIKFSQVYRQIKDLRNEAWDTASACGGYGYLGDNVGGFKVNLDFLEPTNATIEYS